MDIEALKKQLDAWTLVKGYSRDSLEHRMDEVQALPKKLQIITAGLFTLNENFRPDYSDSCHEKADAAWLAFIALPVAQRKKILTALVGSASNDMELIIKWSLKSNYSSYGNRTLRYSERKSLDAFEAQSLFSLLGTLLRYERSVISTQWICEWAGYFKHNRDFGTFFAAVIDNGGKNGQIVFDTLCQSLKKEHDIAIPSSSVYNGLLRSSKKDGWELVEKLFLAAQRQEGLRQEILQAANTAHPDAFVRLLRIIVDNNLVRFSSVVQAFNGWYEMQWSHKDSGKISNDLTLLLDMLENDNKARKTLKSKDPKEVYLALRAIGFHSAESAAEEAIKLAKHKNAEHRFVAVRFLNQVSTTKARECRIRMLDDVDLRIATIAATRLHTKQQVSEKQSRMLFDAVLRLVERAPETEKKFEAVVWPWYTVTCSKADFADQLPNCLGELPVTVLIPYISLISSSRRSWVCTLLAKQGTWDEETRACLLSCVGSASKVVSSTALDALDKKQFVPDATEMDVLTGYLTRTIANLRTGVIKVVLNSTDAQALAAVELLIGSKNKNQRLASLEILRELTEAGRCTQQCQDIAASYLKQRKSITKVEQVQLDAVFEDQESEISFDDCLGLIDPSELSPSIAPVKHKVKAVTAATMNLVKSLDEFVHLHREMEVTFTPSYLDQVNTVLLGEMRYGFPSPEDANVARSEKELSPVLDLLAKWYKSLDKKHTDTDNFHLLRALNWLQNINSREIDALLKFGKKGSQHQRLVDFLIGSNSPPTLRYSSLVHVLLSWCWHSNRAAKADRFILEVAETAHAMVPQSEIEALAKLGQDESEQNVWDKSEDFRHLFALYRWANNAFRSVRKSDGNDATEIRQRAWQLVHWRDQPIKNAPRNRPDCYSFAVAYEHGWVNKSDIHDQLIGPRATNTHGPFSDLTELTNRVPRSESLRHYVAIPEVANIIESIIDRLFEIEIARGETDTLSTGAMKSVKHFNGIDRLMQLMEGLDKAGFVLQGGSNNRAGTFTSLIGALYPATDDTPEVFAKAVNSAIKSGQFSEERLLQLAFYAPQWCDHIARALGWKGFVEAMYWFMAHMKYVGGLDNALSSDEELKRESDKGGAEKLSRWGKIVRERTPFTAEERRDGAIDVNWFRRTYELLNAKRWTQIANAAKYASSSQQANRAQMVADVLLGKYPKKQLVEGITKRHLKENVRLLGLLPLTKGLAQQKDLQNRYELLQNYKKYAQGLSSMSRPEAMRSVEIGMQNLASTAGYPDAFRLQWALEAEATKDLAEGPVSATKGDITLKLALDDEAMPVLTTHRADKPLKALPRAAAKDKKIAALVERHKLAKQQASRLKHSLEELMCRCDQFSGEELSRFADHALLWPQLERLVLISDRALGFPCRKGKALKDHSGSVTTVKKSESVRVAHPHDLLKNKDWPKWQRHCFNNNIRQPFKQVFRELYPITAQEKKDKDHSNRYASHQVNSQQAYALWGTRNWSRDEYDNVWKAIYNEPINIEIAIEHGYATPLAVEGLTLDKIRFFNRHTHKPIKMTDVSAVLFSEVMRDIDLVVSIAHIGEVDPEVSASTVDMRKALLKETCQLLKMKNLSFKADRAIVKGKLAEYTVHLGSGVVHKMPGGAVCLVPVHSQHRGRVFLPFADDDPRTAEVISKCLMLARDDEIDDPVLLRQIVQ